VSENQKKKEHTVEYTPMSYHTMCQADKERIRKLQDKGIPTPYDPTPSDEDASDGFVMLYRGY
jgi:hypothetical protein|tara:strand:- start:7563 stop:7751 length:189 start_codon:yes stop_codon:yes gene_type:complete